MRNRKTRTAELYQIPCAEWTRMRTRAIERASHTFRICRISFASYHFAAPSSGKLLGCARARNRPAAEFIRADY